MIRRLSQSKIMYYTLWLLLVAPLGNATVLVTGNDTTPYSFTVAISAKVFDPATGSLYVGLSSEVEGYSISRADRPIDRYDRTQPSFTKIAPSGAGPIKNLALVTFTGNATRTTAATPTGAPLVAYTRTTDALVYAVKYDGLKTGALTTLLDAAGLSASKTVGLAANCSYIFVGVAPNDSTTFGDLYSGIAVVCIKENSSSTLVMNQTAAEPGDSTIKAKRLDTTTPQLYVDSANPPTIDLDTVYLFWSDYLQRLYIGLDITATTTGGKAVIVGYVDNGALVFNNIADNAALDAEGDVVATSSTASIQIPFIKTMHASTGPSYLITYGGDVTNPTDALSRISALPLVDNPTDITHHGTLAKYDAALIDYKFVTPATAIGDLAQYDDDPVMVGAGLLPMLTTTVSDMEVVGDTVYVALTGVQSSTNDNGVFYSQAQFDAAGKVSHWTPWTKRAYPFRGFCNSSDCTIQTQSFCEKPVECNSCCQNAGVAFVAVDAVTGNVWAVDGFSKQIVRLTTWDRGSCISPLPCQVNAALPCGCYSVLDLDQATRGFAPGYITGDDRDTTEHRYAIFGGCNKVVFTRVSEAIPTDDYITIDSPQKIMTNFCPITTNDCCTTSTGATNFRETSVAPEAGCVYHLEYSRSNSTEGSKNYFFAGTNSGLYVFANPDGSGFDVADLTTVDQPPFSTGVWFPIDTLTETIVDLKVINPDLFVVTRTIVKGKIVCKLYQIPLATDINLMFDPLPAPIATSGTGALADVLLFTGLQPINDGTTSELLLSTNRGLFLISTTITQVPDGVTTMFAGIGGIDTPYPTTVWPFSVQAGKCKTYTGSSIYQMSGPTPTAFVPEFFNASCDTCSFEKLYPITYFWSDGARRFFIVNRPCDCPNQNRIMIYPYAVEVWNVKTPIDQVLLNNSFIDGARRFNWVRPIGATGILMAGVNNGVIALE